MLLLLPQDATFSSGFGPGGIGSVDGSSGLLPFTILWISASSLVGVSLALVSVAVDLH